MLNHPENCADSRGIEHLKNIFNDIAKCMKAETPEQAIDKFEDLLNKLELGRPCSENRANDLEILADSVNETRLKNSPVTILKDGIKEIYDRII